MFPAQDGLNSKGAPCVQRRDPGDPALAGTSGRPLGGRYMQPAALFLAVEGDTAAKTSL